MGTTIVDDTGILVGYIRVGIAPEFEPQTTTLKCDLHVVVVVVVAAG